MICKLREWGGGYRGIVAVGYIDGDNVSGRVKSPACSEYKDHSSTVTNLVIPRSYLSMLGSQATTEQACVPSVHSVQQNSHMNLHLGPLF